MKHPSNVARPRFEAKYYLLVHRDGSILVAIKVVSLSKYSTTMMLFPVINLFSTTFYETNGVVCLESGKYKSQVNEEL